MDKKQSLDLGLIVPILIGFFSVFGICLVILMIRLTSSRGDVKIPNTATPFQYLFLGTEPGVSTTSPDEEAIVTETETPISLPLSVVPFETNASETVTSTAGPGSTESSGASLTQTPTSASSPPLNPGIYDEADAHLTYTGDWTSQTGVSGAYQNSLHVSNKLGNTIAFRFIGQQIRIFYQSGPSLGTIRIVIDGLPFDLDQSKNEAVTSEWASALLINGTHSVVITHQSGGSINLDYVIVPDVLTTPSPTYTPTP